MSASLQGAGLTILTLQLDERGERKVASPWDQGSPLCLLTWRGETRERLVWEGYSVHFGMENPLGDDRFGLKKSGSPFQAAQVAQCRA